MSAHQEGFAVGADETATDVRDAFDAARQEFLAVLATCEPAAEITEPAAPWHGIAHESTVHVGYVLVRLVEEFARHGGSADILREQIDGVAVPRLVMTENGAPANSFSTPYTPSPGTLV